MKLHKVNLLVPEEELGELFSWVAALKGTSLVSTELAMGNPLQQKEDEIDPRLVYHVDDKGVDRMNVEASLKALNLTFEDLQRMKTRAGTSEHRVKMATVSSKRSTSPRSLGPANLQSGVLVNGS